MALRSLRSLGPVAQSVEQGTFNPKVGGSIPPRPIGRYHPGMARRLLAGVAVAAALATVGPATAGQVQILRAATAVHRHVVLQLSVADLSPTELVVAKRRAVGTDGAFLGKNVRLREAIRLPYSASAVVRWRSPKALHPGVYFVQVMAVETGGVTDCPQFLPACNERWSNVRRVAVRR